MKLFSLFITVPVCLFISLILPGCNHSRQVVPFDIDVDEITKPLSPNDDSNPMDLTFGKENIPGFVFDYEMETEKPDVFVFFQNLTILDTKPEITQDIFEFIQGQLCEYGFINDSVSLVPGEFESLISSGLKYNEAAARLIDRQKQEFNSQIETLDSLNYPFNIYFNIYPVYLDKNYVTYWQSAYCYTGGAHGITTSYLKTYDLNSGKLLTYDNIIKENHLEEVREEVAAHMAYSYPIYENISTVEQYLDSLNVWLDHFSSEDSKDLITVQNFPLNDVAITKDGLVFMYQMYELTPGSDGCPMVLIPYKDIKGCLQISL